MNHTETAKKCNFVECSKCGASPGSPCRTPGGRITAPHCGRALSTLTSRNLKVTDGFMCLSVDPPEGHVFTNTGLHYFDAHYGDGELHASLNQAAIWLCEETANVSPCERPNCGVCGWEEP